MVRTKVVHVRLGLGELHLVHALAGVPVKEGLAAEHRGELLGDAWCVGRGEEWVSERASEAKGESGRGAYAS